MREPRIRPGLVLLIAACAWWIGHAAHATTRALVPDGDTGVVMILDADDDLSLGTIRIEAAGLGGSCAISPDQSLGFVTDHDGNVWVLDLTGAEPGPAGGTNPIRISDRAVDMVLIPDQDRLLVCGASRISVVDLATRAEIGVFNLGSACDAIDVCADGTVLVATSEKGVVRSLFLEGDGSLTDSTERLARDVGSALGPRDVACDPSSGFGVTVDGHSPEVVTFSLPSLETIETSPMTGPGIGSWIVAPDDGGEVFAGAGPDRGAVGPVAIDVFGMNATTGAPSPAPLLTVTTDDVSAARRGREVIALHPDGSRLYVPMGDRVGVFDAFTGEAVEVVSDPELTRAGGVCFAAAEPVPGEDLDADGAADGVDNCPAVANPEQHDQDGDGVGDACDRCPSLADPSQADDDGDSVGNACDNCPTDPNPDQIDQNRDGVGDACALPPPGPGADTDGDGVPDESDNCPEDPNSDQVDADGDGFGDVCDTCPTLFNPDQGAPVILNGDGTSVYDEFVFSPDSATVVYRGWDDSPADLELFAAPVSGGAEAKLNGPLVANGDVSDEFKISPDSSRVVYLADERTNGMDELFSAPITGGPSVRLNGPLVSGGDVSQQFDITPDGSRVVYRAEQQPFDRNHLYSVPIHGGSSVRLSVGLGNGWTRSFAIGADSQHVVFQFRVLGGEYQLYSTPVTGGPVTLVSDPPSWEGEVYDDYVISGDGAHVFYRAEQDTYRLPELYVSSIGGGPATKLNGPVTRRIDDFQVSADDSWVVYRTRTDESHTEIYGVAATGGPAVRLNEPIEYDSTFQYRIAADNETVVYLATEDTPDVRELYRVGITGEGRAKLNAPLAPGGEVTLFTVSADGSSVVYVADPDGDRTYSLYHVSLEGGQPRKISADHDIDDYPFHFVSPDGGKIVYWDTDLRFFLVSSLGGIPRLLASPPAFPFIVSPDFSSSVYRGSEDLFSLALALDGDADGLLDDCDACVDRDGDGFGDPEFAPTNECPVDNCPDDPNADQTDTEEDQVGDACDNCPGDVNPDQADGDFDEIGDACDPCPGDPVNDEDGDGTCGDVDNCPFIPNADQLDSDGDSLGDVCDICPFDYDPDQLDSDGDGVGDGCDVCPEIFNPDQVDLDSDDVGDECDNCPAAPNPDQADSDQDGAGDACDPCPGDAENDADADGVCGDVDNCPGDPNPSQDDIDEDTVGDACDTCPTLPNPQQGIVNLNEPIPDGDVLENYVITSDGSTVVYRARFQGVEELYTVPANGGTIAKLNHPLYFQQDVYSFRVSGDGSTVTYTSDAIGASSGLEMFSVPLAGGTPINLSENQTHGVYFQQFEPVDDGSTVVYVADQRIDGRYELFSTSSAGGDPVLLSLDRAGRFEITPDDTHVVYIQISGSGISAAFNLYSVPVLGGSPRMLNAPLPVYGNVSNRFETTPDSSRVVYIADQEVNNRIELFSVSLDGQDRVKLSAVLHPYVYVHDFYITPDGSRVVYLANQEDEKKNELFVVPIGGGASWKISGPLQPYGDVLDAMISPDGTTVVYRADAETNNVLELYSAPIAGGPAVKLNGALVYNGNVEEPYFITADSSRVIYLADQDTDRVRELYSVPIDGGEAVKLNGPLDPDDDVTFVEPSGDSATVVYWAFRTNALYAVPVTGGDSTRINHVDAGPNVSIRDFKISPDNTVVIFRSNPNDLTDNELFSTPLALDTDGDGILDDCDGCPLDPYKTEPGICGCGASDDETDPPLLTCPADVTVECGNSIAPDATGVATGEDACGPPAIEFVDAFLTECGSSGTVVRSWTATDALGNADTCDQTLSVVDTTPPTLTVPAQLVLECNTFGGVALSDPAVQEWLGLVEYSDACGPVMMSPDAPALIPVGVTTVTFLATDACDNVNSDTSSLSIVDTVPPQLSVEVAPSTLWPPNHEMVRIDATVISSDVCSPMSLVLSSVTSNEADNGAGDGNTVDDIQGAAIGTPDYELELRAERAGQGNGRIYTAVYTVQDSSGNARSEAGFVVVPHDQGGVTEPVSIALSESSHGTLVFWDEASGALSYDVIRGRLECIAETDVAINLGAVTCIEADSADMSTAGWEDAEVPEPGKAFFYLVEYYDGTSSSFGTESASKPRAPGAGNCEGDHRN